VYATLISLVFELFFINYLFTIDVVSGVINLIQHTGINGKARTH